MEQVSLMDKVQIPLQPAKNDMDVGQSFVKTANLLQNLKIESLKITKKADTHVQKISPFPKFNRRHQKINAEIQNCTVQSFQHEQWA